MTHIKAACVQMTSGPEIDPNLRQAGELIREAAGQGAKFISTPENTCHIRVPFTDKIKTSPMEEEHPGLPFFSSLARDLGIHLLIGSMSIKISDEQIANRSFFFAPSGDLMATYDKIHMFDVDLPTGEKNRESQIVRPGEKAVIVETPFAKIGLTICYDLRFGKLYRDLAHKGAEIMTIPSAFTVPTGQAHWEVLQRARAIENGVFIVSAAQCGEHMGGRRTYGHSIIVSPWGAVRR